MTASRSEQEGREGGGAGGVKSWCAFGVCVFLFGVVI